MSHLFYCTGHSAYSWILNLNSFIVNQSTVLNNFAASSGATTFIFGAGWRNVTPQIREWQDDMFMNPLKEATIYYTDSSFQSSILYDEVLWNGIWLRHDVTFIAGLPS